MKTSALSYPLPRETVTLPRSGGDVSVEVTALTPGQEARLRDVYLRPQPPLMRDPLLGTDPVPNTSDPRWAAGDRAWMHRLQVLRVCAAINLETDGGGSFTAAMSENWLSSGPSGGAHKLRAWAAHALNACGMDAPEQPLAANHASASVLSTADMNTIAAALERLSDPFADEGRRIEQAKKALSALSPLARGALLDELKLAGDCPSATA